MASVQYSESKSEGSSLDSKLNFKSCPESRLDPLLPYPSKGFTTSNPDS